MLRLSGKNILVTAASRGIGRACAEHAAAAGANVVATDIDAAGLAEMTHPAITTQVLDGVDGAAVAAFLSDQRAFDAVIHCIGTVHHGSVLDCDLDTWRVAFRVNVDSFFHVLQGTLPAMVAAGGGSVTCISSVASSLKGLPNRAVYGASKAALIGLVKSVAADFVTKGIRCNAVCPGTITSPSLLGRVDALGREVGGGERAMAMFVERQPMGRLGTTDEVAQMCIYLASDESRFVTGQSFAIDGGMTI